MFFSLPPSPACNETPPPLPLLFELLGWPLLLDEFPWLLPDLLKFPALFLLPSFLK